MRELIIARLLELLEECQEDGLGLETPDGDEITTVEELNVFTDQELLEFFEYTVGFQG